MFNRQSFSGQASCLLHRSLLVRMRKRQHLRMIHSIDVEIWPCRLGAYSLWSVVRCSLRVRMHARILSLVQQESSGSIFVSEMLAVPRYMDRCQCHLVPAQEPRGNNWALAPSTLQSSSEHSALSKAHPYRRVPVVAGSAWRAPECSATLAGFLLMS